MWHGCRIGPRPEKVLVVKILDYLIFQGDPERIAFLFGLKTSLLTASSIEHIIRLVCLNFSKKELEAAGK